MSGLKLLKTQVDMQKKARELLVVDLNFQLYSLMCHSQNVCIHDNKSKDVFGWFIGFFFTHL